MLDTLLVWKLKRVDFLPLENKMAGKLVTWDGKKYQCGRLWKPCQIGPNSHIPPYEENDDAIIWNLTHNGEYFTISDCNAQFLGPLTWA
jgi:hypothetical protein